MEVLSSILVVTGSLLSLISAIGLHRFRDVFARVHAAGKAAPLGAALVFLATAIQLGDPGDAEKLLLALLLLAITFPTGIHMVARAAYRSGTELSDDIEVDELAEALRASEPTDGDDGSTRDPSS